MNFYLGCLGAKAPAVTVGLGGEQYFHCDDGQKDAQRAHRLPILH